MVLPKLLGGMFLLQYTNVKGVGRSLQKPKPRRLLGPFFFCALTFCLFSPLFGQERVIQRVTAPIAAPIQSVQSALTQSIPLPPKPPQAAPVNSTLPGFGTLSGRHSGDSAISPSTFSGSLDFLPPETSLLQQMRTDEAFAARMTDSEVIQTQFLSSSAIPQLPDTSELGFRRIQFSPRSDNLPSAVFQPYDPQNQTRGGIVVITGGINLIIEGIEKNNVLANSVLAGDTVDISADNLVIWTENPSKIHVGASYTESESFDFQLYLEGNIIYRDGPRVVQASRMYFDAKHKVAYILDGQLRAPISDIPGVEGFVRLKADILRQMADGVFTARNALVTTSQLGEPTYSRTYVFASCPNITA